MQPYELKRLRGVLGLTQAGLGGALGVSRKLVNQLEAGRAPLDRRTTLAVRQLFIETKRSLNSQNFRATSPDVPLACAMILWKCKVAGKPAVLVASHPDGNDPDYSFSVGACSADWADADDVSRILRLFGFFLLSTIEDGCAPADVHGAFSVIPEYRRAMQRGMFTA